MQTKNHFTVDEKTKPAARGHYVTPAWTSCRHNMEEFDDIYERCKNCGHARVRWDM